MLRETIVRMPDLTGNLLASIAAGMLSKLCESRRTLEGDDWAAEPLPKAAKALKALSRGFSPGVDKLLRSTPACTKIGNAVIHFRQGEHLCFTQIGECELYVICDQVLCNLACEPCKSQNVMHG